MLLHWDSSRGIPPGKHTEKIWYIVFHWLHKPGRLLELNAATGVQEDYRKTLVRLVGTSYQKG
jgi:hypothetical protein